MSTDHQRYSIDNQSSVNAAYAAIHNLTIVRTYSDAGRSGLRVEGRDALRRLIDDVQSERADFGTILVYDVSRWGRFQDADEAAHYEFICKQAGIKVRYCAEEFENDGSLLTTIVKGMKRAMAAEFSRELSRKVLEGQKLLAGLGFRQGATPGYGLRRLLIDENGKPKGMLKHGQHKHLQTDRVILVPGPPKEIRAVREIFRMFAIDHTPVAHIARRLNERGIANAWGNPWTTNNVFKLLKNENYIGNYVYNQRTQKLLSKPKRNPRPLWIRKEGAFKAIVDPAMFDAAQKLLTQSWTYSDNEILDYLSAALCRYGHLSSKILRDESFGPSITTCYYRFGKLSNAYLMIGYKARTRVSDPLYRPMPAGTEKVSEAPWTHDQFRYRP
ncbi:recombinase family protein [Pseudolabrys taiwanensis]|nr:recombinase family protein [Pseudolabrys taiwanensis]